MKLHLYSKLLISYIIFGLLVLLILGTYSQDICNKYIQDKETKELYHAATVIATDLKYSPYQAALTIPDKQNEFEALDSYLDAEIWVTDAFGNLIMDSSSPAVFTNTLFQLKMPIKGFNIQDFGNSYSMIGDFYGRFSEPTLTVFSPITRNYKVIGYVLLHKSMEDILADGAEFSDVTFYSATIIFLCSFIILIAFTIIVNRPLRKIAKVTNAYAKGDFSQRIDFHSNDEFGNLADTLNYMAIELETREEEQKKFISNVSHDFRSPLTSIKGYVEAMIDGTIPVEMQEKYLNIILFEADRLNKLTKNILNLNHFGHHGIILDLIDFDINQMIRNTTRTFEGICNKKGLVFELILTEQQLFAKGDMGKIQQVLYNLIDNATKFSHPNTAITVETSIKNEKVFISVKDSGIGISKENTKKVFDRFYKTDQSRGRDKKGTGLGLSIVKEIIQAHKENINVISTEGVGTEFIFSLPLSKKEQI